MILPVLELLFASFLEKCPDVVAYAKNYFAVHFSIDYVNDDGNISAYYPDFIVKTSDSHPLHQHRLQRPSPTIGIKINLINSITFMR